MLSVLEPSLLGTCLRSGGEKPLLIDSSAIQGAHIDFSCLSHWICVIDVAIDRCHLSNKRQVADVHPGYPDGMRLDEKGRVYLGALDGVPMLKLGGCYGSPGHAHHPWKSLGKTV